MPKPSFSCDSTDDVLTALDARSPLKSSPSGEVPPVDARGPLSRGEARAGPKLAKSADNFELSQSCLSLLSLNIRSFRKHRAELEGRLSMLPNKPSVVVITETWLDSNTEFPLLSGYHVAARLDRCNSVHANETDCDSEEGEIEDFTTTPSTRKKGGRVIVFAMDSLNCSSHREWTHGEVD